MLDPKPSSPEVSARLSRVGQRNTKPEVLLRRLLHSRGLRYRIQVKVLTKPRRIADLVFPRKRVAVFVDGCFWHGCPEHATWPKSNSTFWRNKIEANRARDRDTNLRLEESGWKVVRVWEHEDPMDAADRIETLLEDHEAGVAANG